MSDSTLKELWQQVAEKKSCEAKQKELTAQRNALADRLKKLEKSKLAEQADVDRLEGHSLTAFFYQVIGKMDEKLDKERQEAYAARVKYDAALHDLSSVEADLEQIQNRLVRLSDCDRRYQAALSEKIKSIKASAHPAAQQVAESESRIAALKVQKRELLEAIAGLQHLAGGKILYHNPKTGNTDDLCDKTPMQIRELGVRLSFVPEDRLGMGLVGQMDIVDNMMLRSYRKGKSFFLERKTPRSLAERIIDQLEVVTPSANTPVRRLSGGNVQKVLVGREIAASPTVLMAAYPVRGLDINSSYTIYNLLTQQKENGVAVIYVGEDLDVLVELCDRIMVIGSGRITGMVDGRKATKEEIGLLMTKTERGMQDA